MFASNALAGQSGIQKHTPDIRPSLRDDVALAEQLTLQNGNVGSVVPGNPPSINSNLHHIGRPDVSLRVDRRGDLVMATDAVEQIIPKDWSIAAKKAVDMDRRVNWPAGKPWVETLNIVAYQSGFGVDLDWDRKHAVVRPLVDSETDVPVQYAHYKTNQAEAGEGEDVLPLAKVNYRHPRTIEEFMNQVVEADIRGATVPMVMQELLPPGWVVELVGVVDRFKDIRFDYTTPELQSRGRALHELGLHMNVRVTPYVHLRKVIISEVSN